MINKSTTSQKLPNQSSFKDKQIFYEVEKAQPIEDLVLGPSRETSTLKQDAIDPTDWPYCCVGKLRGKLNGKHHYGIATLVGPNIAVTSAQNVFDLKRKKALCDLELILNEGKYERYSSVVKIWLPEEKAKWLHLPP